MGAVTQSIGFRLLAFESEGQTPLTDFVCSSPTHGLQSLGLFREL